eukprot:6366968-Prymnesium_polylepis.2
MLTTPLCGCGTSRALARCLAARRCGTSQAQAGLACKSATWRDISRSHATASATQRMQTIPNESSAGYFFTIVPCRDTMGLYHPGAPPRYASVLSRAMYVPPTRGSEMRLKKDASATQLAIEVIHEAIASIPSAYINTMYAAPPSLVMRRSSMTQPTRVTLMARRALYNSDQMCIGLVSANRLEMAACVSMATGNKIMGRDESCPLGTEIGGARMSEMVASATIPLQSGSMMMVKKYVNNNGEANCSLGTEITVASISSVMRASKATKGAPHVRSTTVSSRIDGSLSTINILPYVESISDSTLAAGAVCSSCCSVSTHTVDATNTEPQKAINPLNLMKPYVLNARKLT